MNLDEKISKFKAIVDQFPGDELARFSLAHAYFDRGQFSLARDHLLKVVDQNPDWMVATILLGKCCLELGEKDKAKTILEKALQLARDQHHDGPVEEIESLLADML